MDSSDILEVLCSQLSGTGIQSYDILSDVQNFGTDFSDLCLDLIKERGRLEDWVKAWEISDGDGSFHRKLNPRDWQYRYAIGVLARICGLFANLKNLDSIYGVRAVPVQVETKGNRKARLAKSTKIILKEMRNQLSFSDKSKSSVTHPQHTSTAGSPSRTSSSPSPPEGIPTINASIIAHLENPARIEAKVLPPDLSLTDEYTRISDATAEFQKVLPAYLKVQWAVSDKEKFEKLVQQLTKYNDGLYQSLPLPNQPIIPEESRPLSPARNEHYMVPLNSTAIFTGRSDVLEQLHQYFSIQESSDAPRRQRRFILYGMGGSGKTQIAVKFAEDHQDSFWGILWVDASSRETAERSFCDIARVAEVEESVESAQRWLTRLKEEWLLIIDNADDPTLDITDYFPPGNRGNILVTTRNRECLRHGSHHEIKEMKEDEAVTLLLKASKIGSNEGSNEGSNKAPQCALPIVKELGFLALAIDQAGAYIANSCEIDQYLDIFKQHRKNLLHQKSVQGAKNYKWAVYTTWELAFQKVSKENPIAADILQVFSFLHHDGISEEIFQRANTACSETEVPESLMRIIWKDRDKSWDPFRFRNTLATLLRYSLVRREKRTYSVHPLVHSWARDRLEKQEQQRFLRLTISLLSHSITWEFATEDYAFRRQLLSHIDASRTQLLSHTDASRTHSADPSFDGESDPKQVIRTAKNFGLVYNEMGRWREAEEYQIQAVEASETIFGKEDPHTLTTISSLASTYWNQGRWTEAEQMDERVVEGRERILGPEHPDTLSSMGNLAMMYAGQGRWKAALKMGEHVVEARERILGKEHPDTLYSMRYLAQTYTELGRWKEAEALQERVVGANERILGKDHPETLTSMGNLASMYGDQGRLEDAEKMEEHLIEASERILGKEHPETLNFMGNLALTYWRQSRFEEAKNIEERVAEVMERTLGKEHPQTLMALKNLAATYQSLGRLEEAKEIEGRLAEALLL